jgi:hypothetical protein
MYLHNDFFPLGKWLTFYDVHKDFGSIRGNYFCYLCHYSCRFCNYFLGKSFFQNIFSSRKEARKSRERQVRVILLMVKSRRILTDKFPLRPVTDSQIHCSTEETCCFVAIFPEHSLWLHPWGDVKLRHTSFCLQYSLLVYVRSGLDPDIKGNL